MCGLRIGLGPVVLEQAGPSRDFIPTADFFGIQRRLKRGQCPGIDHAFEQVRGKLLVSEQKEGAKARCTASRRAVEASATRTMSLSVFMGRVRLGLSIIFLAATSALF